MIERIRELAAEMKPAMIDLAQRLIRTPSLSGQEKDVADLILAELEKLGYDEVFRDPWGSVCGIIHGTDALQAHLADFREGVAFPAGAADLLCIIIFFAFPGGGLGVLGDRKRYVRLDDALEKTEVIHGRAAADTKSGIACQIYSGAILAQLKKEGIGFKGDYMVSFVVMEEPAEQIGIIGLIDNEFPKRGLHVDGVVSCEATALKIYCGHRGRVEINVEVAGVTSHGASPWLGINAVNKATKLIDAVEAYYAEHYQVDEKLGKSSIALTVINCTPGTMCIVPDRCNITYDRRLVPTETPEDAIAEIQAIIDRLSAEDPDFHATVKVSAVPRTTYTGITETKPNIKEGWRIAEDHPFVAAASNGLRSIGEPVSYGYWDFGTDLAMVSGRHHIASIGYSPMQEYYCHRPVDKCRIDFMERALVGNIAIFRELTKLSGDDFKI